MKPRRVRISSAMTPRDAGSSRDAGPRSRSGAERRGSRGRGVPPQLRRELWKRTSSRNTSRRSAHHAGDRGCTAPLAMRSMALSIPGEVGRRPFRPPAALALFVALASIGYVVYWLAPSWPFVFVDCYICHGLGRAWRSCPLRRRRRRAAKERRVMGSQCNRYCAVHRSSSHQRSAASRSPRSASCRGCDGD